MDFNVCLIDQSVCGPRGLLELRHGGLPPLGSRFQVPGSRFFFGGGTFSWGFEGKPAKEPEYCYLMVFFVFSFGGGRALKEDTPRPGHNLDPRKAEPADGFAGIQASLAAAEGPGGQAAVSRSPGRPAKRRWTSARFHERPLL